MLLKTVLRESNVIYRRVLPNHAAPILRYVPKRKHLLRWQEFGEPAFVQGKCCGPYHPTFGAKHGRGSQRCGSYMFSEILAAKDMLYHYDRRTQSAIGYMERNSTDGWTEAGTWFSFSDRNSVQALTQYISKYWVLLRLAISFKTIKERESYSYQKDNVDDVILN